MATDKPDAGRKSGNRSSGSGSEPELASTPRAVGIVAQGQGHSEQTSGDNGRPPAAGPHHKPLFTQHRSPQAQVSQQKKGGPENHTRHLELDTKKLHQNNWECCTNSFLANGGNIVPNPWRNHLQLTWMMIRVKKNSPENVKISWNRLVL